MRWFTFFLAAVGLLHAKPMTPQSLTTDVTRAVNLNYLLSVPAQAKTDQQQRWPLLVFLHGAGERGSDLSRVAKHGPTKLIRGENLSPAEAAVAPLVRDSFIVAAPQCPEGSWWNPTDVLALMLIVVTVEAEQLPVASVWGIVLVVVVLVMDRKLAQRGTVKFTSAVRTDPGE
mgnify:CR=1 FL=1